MRTVEPTHVTQGEQIEWTREFEDYLPSEWTLEYRFRGPGTGFDVASTTSGTKFLTVLTGTASAAMTVGKWKWQAWATNIAAPTTKLMIRNGEIRLEQGFADNGTATIETRSAAKIALDALDAVISGKATSDQLEYEISTPVGTRKLKRMPINDLIGLRKYYASLVARENTLARVRNGGKFGQLIKTRFTQT